jgi:hypothetical protein
MEIPENTVLVSDFERKSGTLDDRFQTLQAQLWFSSLSVYLDTANRVHVLPPVHRFCHGLTLAAD